MDDIRSDLKISQQPCSQEWTDLKEAVAQSLTVMAAMLANPKEITPQIATLWVMVLQDAGLTAEDVRKTVPRVLRFETFFPTPADFITLAEPILHERRCQEQRRRQWEEDRAREEAEARITPEEREESRKRTQEVIAAMKERWANR